MTRCLVAIYVQGMANTTDTETRKSQAREDRISYDNWIQMQVEAYERTGCTAWFDSNKALRMRKRGSKPPADPFTGPYFIARAFLTAEAIEWFEVLGNARYTFTDWVELQRRQRETIAADLAEGSNAYALDTLAYARELQDRRGALILEARGNGSTWAEITAASGLSRMQAHTLAKASAAVADDLAWAQVAYADDEPF